MQIGNAVPPLLAYQVAEQIAPGLAADLFAGAGGLSLGLQLAGHEVVAAVDHDEAALSAYERNAGHGALLADLAEKSERRVALKELRRVAGGTLDLLAGGPPCQGFSTAGPCLADDPRNRLLHAFVDAVEEVRPRVALMENVPALGQSRGRRQLHEVRHRLHAVGYKTDVALLHAEAYGVPQRRRRLLLLASRDRLPDWPRPWMKLEQPRFPAQQPHEAPGRATHTVGDALGDLPLVEARLDEPAALTAPASTPLQMWSRGHLTVRQLLQQATAVDARIDPPATAQ